MKSASRSSRLISRLRFRQGLTSGSRVCLTSRAFFPEHSHSKWEIRRAEETRKIRLDPRRILGGRKPRASSSKCSTPRVREIIIRLPRRVDNECQSLTSRGLSVICRRAATRSARPRFLLTPIFRGLFLSDLSPKFSSLEIHERFARTRKIAPPSYFLAVVLGCAARWLPG